MISLSTFPLINASLNALSGIFLLLGFWAIRCKLVNLHRICMIVALSLSTAFLACYLYYHAHHGSTPFTGTGWIRKLYFAILISHTVLAVTIVPLIFKTFFLAIKGDYPRHKIWARRTFPLWLYVSVTGVVIYRMLY